MGNDNATCEVVDGKSKDSPHRPSPRPVDPANFDPTASSQNWRVLDVAGVYARGSRLGVYADLYALWDVNDAGYTVGQHRRQGLAGSAAFMTTPAISGISSYAADINEANQVVGSSSLVTVMSSLFEPEKDHAFLWEKGQMKDLNDLVQLPAGWVLTSASAINEYGDIVGLGLINGVQHGFVLVNTTVSMP